MTSVSSSFPIFTLIRRWTRRALPPLLVLTVSLSSRIGRAQDAGAELRTAARDLAVQGAVAFEQQDYTTALDLFARAYALVQAPSIVIMQARSLAKLGRFVEALDKYEVTQHMKLPNDAPEAFKQAVLDAGRESAELWRRVPRLTIHVRVSPVSPNDLTVLLDSRVVPGALLDIAQPTDPGPHEVTVRAKGYDTETRSIKLEPGNGITLDIPLTAHYPMTGLGAIPAGDSSPMADKPSAGSSKVSYEPWAWAAVGVGTAGLALSAITGVIALEKKSALDTQCHPGCPAGASDDISTFRTSRTLSYASLLAGTAALGVGGYVLLSSHGEQRLVGASFSPAHVGVWGNF